VRGDLREPYGTRGSRNIDRRRLNACRLLAVGIVVEIGRDRQTKERTAVPAAQLTRDGMAARYMNSMRDAPTLQHADKKRLSRGGRPNRPLRIRTDAERAHPLEVCEYPSMQQRAIFSDLKGDHAIAERFRDQHLVRACDHQSVRMRHIVSNGSDLAVRRGQKDPGRREAVGTRRVGVERSHVGVSVPGDGHVTQVPDRSGSQVGVNSLAIMTP